jgi:hypothetical protein
MNVGSRFSLSLSQLPATRQCRHGPDDLVATKSEALKKLGVLLPENGKTPRRSTISFTDKRPSDFGLLFKELRERLPPQSYGTVAQAIA